MSTLVNIEEWFSYWLTWDKLKELFMYSEDSPMIFTRLYFWIFFGLVMLIYSVVYKKNTRRNTFLFLVSLFFYYKTSGLFISILLFSTLSDFIIGKMIYKSKKKTSKKFFVGISVAINLFVLSYFKYAYFFTESFNQFFQTDYSILNHFAQFTNAYAGTHFEVDKILLPVGISFFTFQTISYSVDIYREKIKPVTNLFDFGFYVSFFPQLVSGPIVRASEFIPQLQKSYKLSEKEFGIALFWILKGLTKKVVIGDYIAVNFIDRIFENPLMFTGFENLMALYGYSLQVYADFSGYTDMAIGIALLMGFRLPTNFNSPYKATSVGDFWKRWHMSLSSWLKDYLYIPLGGNRGGSLGTWICAIGIALFIILLSGKWWVLFAFIIFGFVITLLSIYSSLFKKWLTTNINLLITMLLGGLWHGASWQFVIWGGLNGIGLMFYKLWRKISPYEHSKNVFSVLLKIFITFNFITFTRIWFRAENMESTWQIMEQITTNFNPKLITEIVKSYQTVFIVLLMGYVIHWLPSKWKRGYENLFIRLPLVFKIIVSAIIIFIVYQSMSSDLQPFIYFQF